MGVAGYKLPYDFNVSLTEEGVALRSVVQLRMGEPPPPLKGLSDEDAATLRDILQRALDREV